MPNTSAHTPFKSEEGRRQYEDAYAATMALWPVSYQDVDVETTFGTTHVHVCGPRWAPPLVLLHGMRVSSASWAAQVGALSRSYRILAPDLVWDYGKSAAHKPMEHFADATRWLCELLDAFAIERASLLGISYGGWIAARQALRFPQRVDRVALLAPAATFRTLSATFVLKSMPMAVLKTHAATDRYMRWAAVREHGQDERYDQVMDRLVHQLHMGVRHIQDPSHILPDVLTDEELAGIKAPVLMMVGAQEKIYDPRAALQRATQHIEHIQAFLVEDASHDIQLAQTERVNAHLLAFLRGELEGGRGASVGSL